VSGDEEGGHFLERLHELILQLGRLILQHESREQLRVVQHIPHHDGLLVVRVAALVDLARHRDEQIGNFGRRIVGCWLSLGGQYLLLLLLLLETPQKPVSGRRGDAAQKEHVLHRHAEHLGVPVDEYAPQSRHLCAASVCVRAFRSSASIQQRARVSFLFQSCAHLPGGSSY